MKPNFWKFFGLMMVAVLVLAACQPQTPATPTPQEPPASEPVDTGIDCMGAQAGDTITMLYQWSGEEEAKLNQILRPLVDACGIVIQPESTRDQALLDTRV